MIIDMHCHYMPVALADALRERHDPPWIETLGDGSERIHLPIGQLAFGPEHTDMEDRIAFMDGLGITRQMLSFPSLFGLDSLTAEDCLPLLTLFNDDVARLSAAHPDRFSGVAALPVADMVAAVTELHRARDVLNLIGAILPNNCFASVDEAEKLRPLFEAGNSLGAHFFIHPGRRPDEVPAPGTGPRGYPFPDHVLERQALDVQNKVASAMVTLLQSDFLTAFPNVSVHVANLGGTFPMVLERMDHAVRLRTPDATLPSANARRVYVDCSSLGPKALELAVSVYGADRIMLGTDCPIFRTDWTLDAIEKARITDDERKAILFGTAEGLLARFGN
jgi:predicted TIM-barrel fold metal-dependent hydrolase